MAESRDPLPRPDSNALPFRHGRQPANGPNSVAILRDEEEANIGVPFRWNATPLTGLTGGRLELATTRGSGGDRVERAVVARRGRGGRAGTRQGRGTDLPSWFPRRPLGDITAINRAIERRRARLTGHEEDPQIDSPIPPQGQIPHEPLLRDVFQQNLSLNHNTTEGRDGESTPEPLKHHLNHIDSVEKSVLEEIRRLKSTPSAKKAERVRKMKTLMSMR